MYLKIEPEAVEQARENGETQNSANVETDENLNNLGEMPADDE